MSAHWNEIGQGVKVEVLNNDCPLPHKVYWIAVVSNHSFYSQNYNTARCAISKETEINVSSE